MAEPICHLTVDADTKYRKDIYLVVSHITHLTVDGERVSVYFSGGTAVTLDAAEDSSKSPYEIVNGISRAIRGIAES
jgi:argininosuccinate synthase